MKATASPAAQLGGILPGNRVLTGGHAREWASGTGAEAVLFPESAEEVVAIVGAAAETGTRLLPAGRGSWLAAGGWGREARVIVSMSRMDAVAHYEPADLTLTAGAGIGMDALADMLAPNGQWLAADGPGCDGGTLGATVSCGVSGPLAPRYGGVRDNVLGLEVVTGDGRLLRIGGRVVKNVAGFDMVRLFTGSRGSLGLITRASVRLFPLPAADVTLRFGAGNAPEAVAKARAVCAGAVQAASVEVFGGDAMAVVVRLLGGAEEVPEACDRVAGSVGEAPDEVLSGAGSEALHRGRLGWEAEADARAGDSRVVARLAALPDRLGRTVECADEVAGALRGRIAADAMSGLVRVKGGCAASRVDELARCLGSAREAMEAGGGTLTLSEAPRALAARVGWTGTEGGEGGIGGRIKALFDPDSVLAAGRP